MQTIPCTNNHTKLLGIIIYKSCRDCPSGFQKDSAHRSNALGLSTRPWILMGKKQRKWDLRKNVAQLLCQRSMKMHQLLRIFVDDPRHRNSGNDLYEIWHETLEQATDALSRNGLVEDISNAGVCWWMEDCALGL